jgi:adenylate cyclase
LYADIAAYSHQTELDEEGTHLRLIEAMRLVEAHIDAGNGRVVHFAGDAILVKFKDADRALRCAINVQLAARQWNASLDLANQICFRVGVDFGGVFNEHGDIYINAVSLAERLESLACCGGICVSETVRSKLANKSVFKFVAEGKQYVKNIQEPVEAFWIEFDAQQIVNTEQTIAVKISKVAP